MKMFMNILYRQYFSDEGGGCANENSFISNNLLEIRVLLFQ